MTRKLGQNQETALALVKTAPRGQGLTPADLNNQMALGPQRSLDVLERLCEKGLIRRSGHRFVATGLVRGA